MRRKKFGLNIEEEYICNKNSGPSEGHKFLQFFWENVLLVCLCPNKTLLFPEGEWRGRGGGGGGGSMEWIYLGIEVQKLGIPAHIHLSCQKGRREG